MITICSVVILVAISRNTFDTICKYVCTIGARRRLECDSAEYEWSEVAPVSAGWSGVVAAQSSNWRSNMCQNLSKTLKTWQTIQHTTLRHPTPAHSRQRLLYLYKYWAGLCVILSSIIQDIHMFFSL